MHANLDCGSLLFSTAIYPATGIVSTKRGYKSYYLCNSNIEL